jgi:inhibitor of cysteine peptidase
MKIKKISQLILITLSLICGAAIAADKSDSSTYNEDNTTIQVTKKNPQFTIKLKSNPTTGFTWFLREYSTKMITPVKHDFVAPEKKLIGAPGYETWTFRVNEQAFVVPQMLTIRMIYARPWKSNDAGTQVIFRVVTGK